MKKSLLIIQCLILAAAASAAPRNSRGADAGRHRADSIVESVTGRYSRGAISADSAVTLARYHMAWNPDVAERCLRPVAAKGNVRAVTELGRLYLFMPQYASQKQEGLKLLEQAAAKGDGDAKAYLGLYYFNNNDFKTANKYFDALHPMNQGFALTAKGIMSTTGNGMPKDLGKAREYYRKAAHTGYERGMALYGFNMRAQDAGAVDYPESFFWLYIAGDLGNDAARTTLNLRRLRANTDTSEVARGAATALQLIETVQAVKGFKNDPLYKQGFLGSLKAREKAAEQGDDWARYYLGSMNYNGDFLNQNYKQALRYYEPIARNGKLPRPLLAQVNERLAQMYRDGKGVKADRAKAEQYARAAAACGSASAYKSAEGMAQK